MLTRSHEAPDGSMGSKLTKQMAMPNGFFETVKERNFPLSSITGS